MHFEPGVGTLTGDFFNVLYCFYRANDLSLLRPKKQHIIKLTAMPEFMLTLAENKCLQMFTNVCKGMYIGLSIYYDKINGWNI